MHHDIEQGDKKQLVAIHLKVVNDCVGDDLEPLMHCLPACDQFKQLCDDLGKALQHELPNSDETKQEIELAQKHVHKTVSKRYVDLLGKQINQTLVANLPADWQDIVRSQIKARIAACMFTKKSCKLVESTDAVEIFFRAFKSSKMLQMVASDDKFVTHWSMVQSQMGKVVLFSLTWELWTSF